MKKDGFFCDPHEGATATPEVSNKVFIVLILNLSMESGNILVHDMNFILRISADHPTLLFQRKTIENR